MNWFKKIFAKWSREAWEATRNESQEVLRVTSGGSITMPDTPDQAPNMRFAIRNAINGKFIEISTYKPQQRGPDWTTEYYLVPEGKKVSEALTMLMLMKGADD